MRREFHKSVCSPSVRGPASRKQVVARANWGAPVEFTSAKVLRNREVTPQAHQVFVDVGSLATGYTKPGQFIQAKVDPEGKPGFFAIASPPDVNNQGVLELLVKRQPGSAADAICDLQEGSELKVSPVMGKGFPVDQIPAASFPTVLMFATGSGISPIKAVIESGVLEVSKRKDVRLYYGTKSEDATPYLELIPAWNALGVKVNLVHSGDSKNYVQDAFSKDPKKLEDPASVGVLLVGQKDMCQAVTGMLKEQGVQQIMLNF
ncbi:hypothetical protein DUNSADRAFT_12128 [Dunaliella salina]|uniref:FAD-binding FR-type domain-containing protein n=1 Tax=Dunaliella salina TaxID=3046 RepID=A0ABQ7GBX2_DUNSA|nr:hypothetical protein DUNSADRAFT_12128 [Dunaliella salina]|eukprot:KAF5832117.1 hypothetical protein DUNSADRAFT_12128 [Dunaliella salina]